MEKLKRVTRLDSIPAGSTCFDEQGFLHDMPIVTSTGIFEYALPDGGVRRELRLPEYVFDKESLASYSGKPIIITHNAGSIDKKNVMDEIVGTVLSEGFQDGENVRCKIVIHDIDKVKKLPMRELSLGYSLDLIEEPGEWNGQLYDAIQTNIRVNHLAIVESARAGQQAHLNLDGKKIGIDDISQKNEGGNNMSKKHADSIDLTPEELIEALKQYKASKTEPAAEPVPSVEEPEVKDAVVEEPEASEQEPSAVEPPVAPEEPPKSEVPEQNDDVGALIAAVEKLLTAVKAGNIPNAEPDNADGDDCGEPENEDSSEDMSQSMNNDSADTIVKERLSICRMGDKLNLDGLEKKSVIEGKKEIIKKVLPHMNLDGKDDSYINVAYDLAVNELTKTKDVNYQRQQMTANPEQRMDSNNNMTMAASARQRMLEREGGNK